MILIAVLVVGLAALGWVTLAGATMSDGPRRGRLWGGPALSLGALKIGGLALLAVAVAAVGLAGLRGGSGGESPTPTPTSTDPRPAPGDEPAPRSDDTAGPSQATEPALLGPVVRLTAQDPSADPDGFPTLPRSVDELDDETVLRVHAGGFEPFARARAEQCVTTPAATRCSNSIDVQVGADGRASFQYLVTADAGGAAGERCGPEGWACSLVVRSVEDPLRAELRTVFGGDAPQPGRVMIRPRSDIGDGDTVTVAVEGFPAGARARAVLCAAPATADPDRCGPPGPYAELEVGPDGTATARLRIDAGPVGAEGVRCGRGASCGVAVLTGGGAAADVVPITFAGPAGPEYEGGRLGAGLAMAALLLAAVLWLVRRTDWTAVGEAAAPEIDEATYADLDAIVAALPPEEPDVEDLLVP